MSQENERIVLILPGDMLEDIDNLKWITKMGRQDVIRQAVSEYIDRHATELGKEPTLEEYMELDVFKNRLLNELKKFGNAPAVSFMQKCGIISYGRTCIIIGCPNIMVAGMLERVYRRKVEESAKKVLGRPVQIVYRVAEVVPADEAEPGLPGTPDIDLLHVPF